MRIVEILQQENGSHRNQESGYFNEENCPEGWAVIPDDMECENYPFGSITVKGNVVKKWVPVEIPLPPEPTNEEKREMAYNTEKVIEWDNSLITVTHAAQLWQYYAAEGSEKATQLTALISSAKSEIRERIHD